MDIEQLREYCLSVKGASESFPFSKFGRGAENILVFKVMDKMFVYIDIVPPDGIFRAWMKCDPARAQQIRTQYQGIYPAFRQQEWNWNTVELDSDVPDRFIQELIDHSVDEVIKTLSKKRQQEYREK